MFFESIRDSISYQSNETDNYCPTHFHRSAEILYVHSGEKHVVVNGESIVLHENDVLFCPPYAVHVFLPSKDSKQTVVTVLPEYCERFESFCSGRVPDSYAIHDENGSILQAVRAFSNTENRLLRLGLANVLFGVFTERVRFMKSKNDKVAEMKRIAEYLQERCTENLTLQCVANAFGYSPTYFSTLFQKHFRASLPQYLNALRVQKAVTLLRTHQVSKLYALCGFNSPQQFFLNFKKVCGCTPKEYLRNMKNERVTLYIGA